MWRSITPDIDIMVRNIAGAAIHALRNVLSALPTAFNEVPEWSKCFGEVGGICKPIVHLGVDVDCVLASPDFSVSACFIRQNLVDKPRRVVFVVPNALQVCRNAKSRATDVARGRHQQVTTEVKHEGNEFVVCARILFVIYNSQVGA